MAQHPSSGSHRVPFPTDDGSTSLSKSQIVNSQTSPDSQTTSSSKQTSSDKLSALPTSTNASPNPNRILRSPNVSGGSSFVRGWRRSLDASTSLPSFATGELEASPSHPMWNSSANLPNTHPQMSGTSEGSPGKETPRQRVSFESDRASLPTTQSVRNAFSRFNRGSDPIVPSPVLRSAAYMGSQDVKDANSPNSPHVRSLSPSNSRSRAASPLRLFQQWSAGLHRAHRGVVEEPFVPVDPFKFRINLPCFSNSGQTQPQTVESGSFNLYSLDESRQYGCDDLLPISSVKGVIKHTQSFLTDTLPRQVYLNLLLRLPAMYWSRVARIFEDAEVSRPDIQRMIDARGGGGVGLGYFPQPARTANIPPSNSEPVVNVNVNANANLPSRHSASAGLYPPGAASPPPIYLAASNAGGATNMSTSGLGAGIAPGANVNASVGVPVPLLVPLPSPEDWSPPFVSPALIRFKHSWEAFIDSLLREWKTLNVVSALLLSAILTIFQIPSAADDPVTRTAALLSLICALMSLSYGCMFIVRFGTMRSMFRAAKWAEEARKTKTSIWWNVWVLLAMPAVWMAWSMVLFVVSIMCFVWRTGSTADPDQRPPLSVKTALAPRVVVSAVFALGMVYFALIVKALRSYGTHQHHHHYHPYRQEMGRGRTEGGIGFETGGDARVGGGTFELSDHGGGGGVRARDVDAAMERRGRARERSTTSTRRREEMVEVRGSPQGVSAAVVSTVTSTPAGEMLATAAVKAKAGGAEKSRSRIRSVLGLGLLGIGQHPMNAHSGERERDVDSGIEVDLEKGREL